jgi:branched-chain amino acid transport system substrate-binding protein
MKKTVSVILLFALLLNVCFGCVFAVNAESNSDKVVKIGVILPFSGGSSYFGNSQIVGYRHAIEDYYAHFGEDMNGLKVELVLGDSASIADTGVSEMERLVNKENVSAIIGTYNSGVAAAIAPLAIKYKVPFQVTNAVSDVILSEDSNYVFRANLGDLCAVDSYVGFFNYLKAIKPIEKVAILYEGTDYGQGAMNNFTQETLPKAGISVVFNESFATDSSDLSTVINKIKASGADLVIPIMFLNDALLFTRQMKEFRVDIPILAYGGGFLGDDYAQQAGDAAEYVMVSGSWIYDENAMGEDALNYAKRFIEETGYTVPNEPYGNGFMGMYVLLKAIAKAGSGDREAIAKALDETNITRGDRSLMFHATFEGIEFADDGVRYNQNKYSSMMYAQVLGGRYQIVYPPNPETGHTPLVYPIPKWSER